MKRMNYPTLKDVCIDAGYLKTMEAFVRTVLKKTISISERMTGWTVAKRGRGVEGTIAWLNHYRRLSKDFEIKTSSADPLIIIAHSMTLLSNSPICEDEF
ncbi:MAG: hypothetical protein Q8Q56_01910 [Alphaproteobacteria bacterium]|nr:hypothetical protein [Alphaproteobacteria bacterium]